MGIDKLLWATNLPWQTPPTHSSVPVHAATLAAHLHMLFDASQYGAVDDPTQVDAVPHLQTPLLQVSPELQQADTLAAKLKE